MLGRADDHPAAVAGAGVAFDETLAFEAVQDGGQVCALQPGGGGLQRIFVVGVVAGIVLAFSTGLLSLPDRVAAWCRAMARLRI